MLSTRDKGLLLQILSHCDRIILKTRDISFSDFMEDKDTQDIICFNLLQIGELSKKLSDAFISENNGIPWKSIKGMRDHIVHGYDKIDIDIIFFTATDNILQLKSFCNSIIDRNN